MKMIFVGKLTCEEEEDIKFYTEDYKNFYTDEKKKQKATADELDNLAVFMNNPWTNAHKEYRFKMNCKNKYGDMIPGAPAWKCVYFVEPDDEIKAYIYGYGETEEEALKNCKDFYNLLQKDYNKSEY